MRRRNPENVEPGEWVDELERSLWLRVSYWRRHPQTSAECAKDFEIILRRYKRPHIALRCLSCRQAQVVHLRMRGLTNQEIARRLKLSPRTVASHLYDGQRKLGVKTQTELVLFGLKHQLVTVGEIAP